MEIKQLPDDSEAEHLYRMRVIRRYRNVQRKRYFYFKWLESQPIPPVPVRPTDATAPAAGAVAGRAGSRRDHSIWAKDVFINAGELISTIRNALESMGFFLTVARAGLTPSVENFVVKQCVETRRQDKGWTWRFLTWLGLNEALPVVHIPENTQGPNAVIQTR